jgi:hypothetical protein
MAFDINAINMCVRDRKRDKNSQDGLDGLLILILLIALQYNLGQILWHLNQPSFATISPRNNIQSDIGILAQENSGIGARQTQNSRPNSEASISAPATIPAAEPATRPATIPAAEPATRPATIPAAEPATSQGPIITLLSDDQSSSTTQPGQPGYLDPDVANGLQSITTPREIESTPPLGDFRQVGSILKSEG